MLLNQRAPVVGSTYTGKQSDLSMLHSLIATIYLKPEDWREILTFLDQIGLEQVNYLKLSLYAMLITLAVTRLLILELSNFTNQKNFLSVVCYS